ncbi:MAG: type II methionyl aminopeptidase [Methanomicrobiales archaeon]|nr:type II methionyl aminopeptidase [Methanomicrobiales archaeon]
MSTPPHDDEVFDCYTEAGKIAARVLRRGAGMIRPGVSLLEVVESVEQMAIDAGAGLAFPLNLSLNEDAAHDTASIRDERLFAEGDVAKLDLGVHLEGYIADTAITVDLGDHALLVEASARALEAAIALVRPGVSIGELGGAIQREIESRGFRPIANLTGHGLARYAIHTPPNIPNLSFQGGAVLEEGMVFAIEPFASTGSGRVSDMPRVEIFQQVSIKPVRLPAARRILGVVRERRGMPFARRWIPEERQDFALSTLIQQGLVRAYPVLADVPGSIVSQHEHTLIVTDEGCIVTTA